MKIFFPSDHCPELWQRQKIEQFVADLKQQSRTVAPQCHEVVSHTEAADIFVFATHVAGFDLFNSNFYFDLRHHRFVKQFPDRCFLWDDKDFPLPILPGLYASLHQRDFDSREHRSFCYSSATNPYIEEQVHHNDIQPDLLVSFVGSISSPIRARLFEIDFQRSDVFIQKSLNLWDGLLTDDRHQVLQIEYAKLLLRSRFVLCPRGNGVSSYRLFETMQAGRVPVILAKGWVFPEGCDWEKFSLRIDERQIDQLPQLLVQYEPQAQTMGALARKAWETWFDPAIRVHAIAELIQSIQQTCPQRSYFWRSWQQRLIIARYVSRHRKGQLQRQIHRQIGTLLSGITKSGH
ncbi:exostosin family protein [Leptolyngbya sp. NIES-3755]|nr:exostosin family protein [Leptolyngbya sp. NIES-3755]